jgi:hypothetical protein
MAAALLAVNNFPLEKGQALLPALKAEGLLEPVAVSSMSLEPIISGLVRSGYDRGKLTWMFAERLKTVMGELASGRLDALADALVGQDKAAGVKLLEGVPGIGPHVARTAWTLLSLL